MTSDLERIGPLQLRVLLICACIAFIDGYDLQSMAFVAPALARDWQLAPHQLKEALSASLLGLAIGSFLSGPLSDWIGRRSVLIGAVIILGLSTLGNAFADTLHSLFLYRFLTGLGLGASMPNVVALTAEFVPARIRAFMITLMFCAVPLGGALGGILSARLIELYDWRAVFIVGGVAPLVLLPAVIWLLPESRKYLAGKTSRKEKIAIAPLFENERTFGTPLLWLLFFCNLFVLHYLVSWLPTVLRENGWSNENAILGASTFQFGGIVGGLTLSYLLDKIGPFRVLLPVYAVCVLVLFLLPGAANLKPAAMLGLSLAGAGLIGAQFCLSAFAAMYYPTSVRATGIGWAMSIGRIGGIVSPLAAGYLIGKNASLFAFFAYSSIPVFLCVFCVMLLWRYSQGMSAGGVSR